MTINELIKAANILAEAANCNTSSISVWVPSKSEISIYVNSVEDQPQLSKQQKNDLEELGFHDYGNGSWDAFT